jgi:acyl-homoserine-lactone acylase
MILATVSSCTRKVAPGPVEITPPPAPAVVVPPTNGRVDVLWDTYGVPHIFAKDAAAAAFAFGWTQMRAHGDLLLRLYAQARGRSAELWGDAYTQSDEWVITNDIPDRASAWLSEQRPDERAIVDAFAAGINAYATAHPDSVNPTVRPVLPVVSTDVLAHIQRVIHFTFLANPLEIMGTARAWESDPQGSPQKEPSAEKSGPAPLGSNAWAIAPRHSASRNSMLLANPHLPWGDMFTWFETQFSTPEADAYGAALVGFPLPNIAFNDSLGWSFTVNTIDAADLYSVTTSGNGYMFDGAQHAFTTKQKTLRIRQPDGTVTSRALTIRSTVHGPVIAQRAGKVLALRVAGLDAPHLVAESWEMLTSHNFSDFEHALSRLQLPMFTVIYADHTGNIMHLFNGRVPQRSRGDAVYWSGVVPGDSSSTLWTSVLSYDQLPRLANPATGWVQNANDSPWSATVPLSIDPSRFPAYIAPRPFMGFRAIRSARMLSENPAMSLADVIAAKHSTRSEEADHLLEDVVHAARVSKNPASLEAADVLEKWDRSTDAASRGAVLFLEFARAFNARARAGGTGFDVPWTQRAPLATPDGIADPAATVRILDAAADRVRTRYGRLDVSWGETHRLVRDGVDLPANGGPDAIGVFRVVDYDSVAPTRSVASGGDSYVAAVEFASPVVARSLLSYGNWSQPGSPHRTDQLPLFASKQLRVVWRSRADVEAHLEAKEVF